MHIHSLSQHHPYKANHLSDGKRNNVFDLILLSNATSIQSSLLVGQITQQVASYRLDLSFRGGAVPQGLKVG
jgi:hypothetical protein